VVAAADVDEPLAEVDVAPAQLDSPIRSPDQARKRKNSDQLVAVVSTAARIRVSSASLIAFTCSGSWPSRSGRRWASRRPAAGFERSRPSSTAVASRARTGAIASRTVFGARPRRSSAVAYSRRWRGSIWPSGISPKNGIASRSNASR
jgi:hypothetical protein